MMAETIRRSQDRRGGATIGAPTTASGDERVLVLMPTAKDAARTVASLPPAGLTGVVCHDLPDLCRELAEGAGALLLTEEAILRDTAGHLAAALRAQPAWSAVPLVVLAREGGGTGKKQELFTGIGANVTLVERPVRIRTLLSVIQAALRTRGHQYEIRDALAERERQAAALAESERQLSLIYNNTSDSLYLARVEPGDRYTFLSANETLLKVSGYTRDQVVGRPMEEIVPASNHELVRAKYREVIRTRRPLVYLETADLPAGRRYGEITLTPIVGPDGAVTHLLGSIKDVTDQMVAEERLRESEERAAFVRRSAGVGFWYCDLPLDVLHWDERVKAHFHLPPDTRVTIDKFWELLHPDDREPTRQAVERSIAERAPYDVDYRTVDPATGAEKWIRAIGRVGYAADGTPLRFDGLTLDVTDRKRAEETARRNEAWLRTVTDSLPALVSYIDRDLCYRFANRAYEEWFRLTPGQMVGKPMDKLLGGEIFEHRRPYIAAALRGESVRFEGLTEHDRLGLRFTEVIYTPHREGGEVTGFFVHVVDVTDRKRTEQALRESEERLRAALDAGRTGVWDWDIVTGRITWSDQVAEFFGLEPGEFDGTYEMFTRHLHAEDAERAQAAVRASMDEDAPYRIEFRIVQKGGAIRWIYTAGQVLRDAAGRPLRMVGATTDVTDRKLAEQRLREAEAEFRAVFESALDAILVADDEGRYLAANPAASDLLGVPREQILGRRVSDFLEPGFDFSKAWREFLDHRHERGNIRLVRPDNSVREAEYSATREMRAGQHLSVVRDVTDRKRAEEALRKQTERLRLLWESASILLTTDEPDAMMRGLFGKIAPHFQVDTYFNFMVDDAGDALHLESCIGIPEETAKQIRRLEFGQAICGNVALHRKAITATFIQQSDDPKAQLVKSFGIRAYACNPLLAGDRLLGTLSFASRSRDQFDAEELEFLATITRYVTVAYERLRLVRELRETDRRKDEFLALLAHELRNPLAPLRNGLQVMRLAGDNPEAATRMRSMMERQLAHMVRLIDDLLDVSRISRNKMELRRSRILLSDVINNAVETARPLIEAANHELSVALPTEPVFLDADLTRLAQIFGNLLTNSAKYTEPGGRIWLDAASADGEVVVSVRDTGIGIPAEALPAIFDMFSQVDRSLERSTGGLGIGLALVRGLVEMHGGSVSAASEGPGRGSTFTVRLPVLKSRPELTPVKIGDLPANGIGPRRRILVVDDNRDSAATMAALLGMLGNDVVMAHDGVEAIEAAERVRPEVVLMDVGMPRLNGYEATRRIRERPWGSDVTIIAVTGWGQESDRAQSRAAGCDGHLVKPVSLPDLQSLLADVAGANGDDEANVRSGRR